MDDNNFLGSKRSDTPQTHTQEKETKRKSVRFLISLDVILVATCDASSSRIFYIFIYKQHLFVYVVDPAIVAHGRC